MNNRAVEPGPVALWVRGLACVIMVAGLIAIGAAALSVFETGRLFEASWYQAVPFVLATIWGFSLFCMVAIKGRPPRYWPFLGTQHWQVGKPGAR